MASLSNKALAVDPLPPELENAPLEKKAEWWQRTSTESGQLRAKVARERYDKAVENKNQILAQMAEAAAETPAASPAPKKRSETRAATPMRKP